MKPDIPCPQTQSPRVPAEARASETTEKSPIVPPACDPRKRLATLKARAALQAGVTVYEIESDFGGMEYIASRWALTKSFSTLDALDAWLTRVTGKAE